MALSRITQVANGSSNQFTVNFALGYLSADDVTVWVTGEVDGLGAKVYRTFSNPSASIFDVALPLIANGINVVFERTVEDEELIVDFEDDKVITEETLNTAQKQALMLIHEVKDGRFSAFQDNADLNGNRLTNVGTGIASTDGINLAQLQAAVLASGNFILPGGGNNLRAPFATGAATYAWRQPALADITGFGATGLTLAGAASAAAAKTLLALVKGDVGLGNVDNTSDAAKQATTASYRSNSGTLSLAVDRVWAAAAPVSLTDAASVVFDMSLGFDFDLLATNAVGATRAIANPTNPKPGQKGMIRYRQDATGGRSITWGANWKHVGSVAAVATVTANAIDTFSYWCYDATNIYVYPGYRMG